MNAKLFALLFFISGIVPFARAIDFSRKLMPDSSKSVAFLSIKCGNTDSVQAIIFSAINIGAPTYNQGNHLGCYRIYEGASYKILYKYGSSCVRVSRILKTAIEKSYGDLSDSEKAWIMRAAFDEILGEPTRTK